MYLMYVDESGDTGLINSPTKYFILSGLVIHESEWRNFTNSLVTFRRTMKATYGLPVRTEIHAAEYVRSPPVAGMNRSTRFVIMRNLLDELAKLKYLSITNIVVNKKTKVEPYDVFYNAWQALFQRFENTLLHANFPGNYRDSSGIVFVDNTDGKKLTALMRKMGAYNPIPNMNYAAAPGHRNMPLIRTIEDPVLRDSKSSNIIQTMDVCAYFLMQRYNASKAVKRAGATKYFDRLRPVLNTNASRSNPLGIVNL